MDKTTRIRSKRFGEENKTKRVFFPNSVFGDAKKIKSKFKFCFLIDMVANQK